MTKGIVYYTDNLCDESIRGPVLEQLCSMGLPMVSVSLKPLALAGNLVLRGERGPLTMFRQILAGLELLDADIAFLCEHDVLYHRSHFDFTPARDDVFYYNEHVWKVRASDGHALYHPCNQVSGLCANRALLIEHYRKRIGIVERFGYSTKMGYEPGTHGRPERVDDYCCESWRSEVPNIDIRHDHNLSPSRWRRDQFRNQKYVQTWIEAEAVPGWGVTKGRFKAFLAEAVQREALV